jgi:ammonia channel protein AmtB
MAERTRFNTYLIFTLVITAVIYPISGHWVWGGGWLASLETPFHDFAGSTVVNAVGAWVGRAGASWAGGLGFLLFFTLKKTIGIRVSRKPHHVRIQC